MEFLTFQGKDYDEAVKRARQKYGSAVRIHTRTTLIPSFRKKGGCQITCYLVEEKKEPSDTVKKAEDDPPASIAASSEVISNMRKTLINNDFSEDLITSVISQMVWADAKDLTEMELRLVNSLVDSAKIDREHMFHPSKYFILHGPSGVGKTLALLKIAAIYADKIPEVTKKRVAYLSFSSSKSIADYKALPHLDLYHITDVETLKKMVDTGFSRYDLILVDPSQVEEELETELIKYLPHEYVGHFFCIDARHKLRQIEKDYERFHNRFTFTSTVVTHCDSCASFGNVLSFCNAADLSLLFLGNGENVNGDIQMANGAYIMSLFNGFSMDFKTMWQNANNEGGVK